MTNPTSNFGWQMPTSSDLVTDLPADFEVFGQAVDTAMADLKGGTTGQVLAKASNANMDFVWTADASGIPASAFTAKGNLLVGTGSGTFVAQSVGTNGQVLTADSAEADGVKWATPAAAANFSLLSTTTLSGSTTTISGISGQNTLQVVVINAVLSSANTQMRFRLNGDTGSNYRFQSAQVTGDNTYSPSMYQNNYGDSSFIDLARNGTEAAGVMVGGFTVFGANATGGKPFVFSGGGRAAGQSGARHHVGNGVYLGTSTISSVSIVAEAGTFSGGTVYVYGSAN